MLKIVLIKKLINLLIILGTCLLAGSCQKQVNLNDNLVLFIEELECCSLRCDIVWCEETKPFWAVMRDCEGNALSGEVAKERENDR